MGKGFKGSRVRGFERPAHPYSRALLAAIPRLEGPIGDLPAIPGVVPAPMDFPHGCRFAPRCAFAQRPCSAAPPPMRGTQSGEAKADTVAEAGNGGR